MKIRSHLVENAVADRDKVILLSPNLANVLAKYKTIRVAVFLVFCDHKEVLACLAGGHMEGEQPIFTRSGLLTFDVATSFTNKGTRLIYREINCNVGKNRMKAKIEEVFRFAEDKSFVVFVGDHQGACDGKIIPHLNLQPDQVTLPVLRPSSLDQMFLDKGGGASQP